VSFEFLSDEQVAAYAAYRGAPSRAELERFFFLDDGDRDKVVEAMSMLSENRPPGAGRDAGGNTPRPRVIVVASRTGRRVDETGWVCASTTTGGPVHRAPQPGLLARRSSPGR
jgi:hypothetical protein